MVQRRSKARTVLQLSPIFFETKYHSLNMVVHNKSPGSFFRIKIIVLKRLTIPSLCKSLIRKLLIKDETKRLGARAGASDVKTHPFFRNTSWALIRHMKPPMIPHQGRGIDTVNFRNVKESASVDIGGSTNKMPGVPLDSGLATPGGEIADPFEEFNSVTLHHEGDE